MKMQVLIECPICHEIHDVFVNPEKYEMWRTGVLLAQEAFPTLTPSEREQLISKICPECQKMIFDE